MTNENSHINLDEALTNQMTVNKNLSQEIILTNTDKVTILLNDHHRIIKKKTEWLSPLAVFISVITTLLTAKFDEQKFGVSPETWKSIFIVLSVISFGVSLYLIVIAICYRKHGTVEEFIKKLKNESAKQAFQQTPMQQGIQIISAKYGADNKFVDVIAPISVSLAIGIYDIKASNELAGDPCPGKQKTLQVIYTKNGKQIVLSALEGATISIK